MSKHTVYFDGGCPLCSREIDFYRSLEGAGDLRWVDICEVEARQLGPGLDRARALVQLHVRNEDGSLVRGPSAFIAIWSALPQTRWLSRISDNRLGRWVLFAAYRLFLVMRPMIPRRSEPAGGTKRSR